MSLGHRPGSGVPYRELKRRAHHVGKTGQEQIYHSCSWAQKIIKGKVAMDELIKLSLLFFGTSIGGILGYLLKTQIDHRLAITRIHETIRVTEIAKAIASFRAAFAPSLAFIYLAKNHGSTHEAPDVDGFLRNTLPELAAAVELFRPFVPKRNSTAYQEAWERYRYEVWNYGFDATTLRADVDNPWKVFEDLVNNILLSAGIH
jgi:hypothetical protein